MTLYIDQHESLLYFKEKEDRNMVNKLIYK
jgi:hypothetical protein